MFVIILIYLHHIEDLLLYHGLGSGKTCSSIAIAEGIKNDRKILVMTPASLRDNYYEELKKCGDYLYKKINIGNLLILLLLQI